MDIRPVLRMAAFVGSAVLSTVAATVVAGPASAADGINCATGYHCVFEVGLYSAKYSFFNGDPNFTDNYYPNGSVVNDNVWSASNSSSGNYESHYYYDIYPTTSSRLVFCVNPGHSVDYPQLSDDFIDGNGVGQRDEVSALILRPRTTVRCF